MLDFLDDLLEHAGDILDIDSAEEIIDSIDPDSINEIGLSDTIDIPDEIECIESDIIKDHVGCCETGESPVDSISEQDGHVAFKGSPTRKGSCYDCDCKFFVPKASHPTTCSVCGHSMGRHHISLGK